MQGFQSNTFQTRFIIFFCNSCGVHIDYECCLEADLCLNRFGSFLLTSMNTMMEHFVMGISLSQYVNMSTSTRSYIIMPIGIQFQVYASSCRQLVFTLILDTNTRVIITHFQLPRFCMIQQGYVSAMTKYGIFDCICYCHLSDAIACWLFGLFGGIISQQAVYWLDIYLHSSKTTGPLTRIVRLLAWQMLVEFKYDIELYQITIFDQRIVLTVPHTGHLVSLVNVHVFVCF